MALEGSRPCQPRPPSPRSAARAPPDLVDRHPPPSTPSAGRDPEDPGGGLRSLSGVTQQGTRQVHPQERAPGWVGGFLAPHSRGKCPPAFAPRAVQAGGFGVGAPRPEVTSGAAAGPSGHQTVNGEEAHAQPRRVPPTAQRVPRSSAGRRAGGAGGAGGGGPGAGVITCGRQGHRGAPPRLPSVGTGVGRGSGPGRQEAPRTRSRPPCSPPSPTREGGGCRSGRLGPRPPPAGGGRNRRACGPGVGRGLRSSSPSPRGPGRARAHRESGDPRPKSAFWALLGLLRSRSDAQSDPPQRGLK